MSGAPELVLRAHWFGPKRWGAPCAGRSRIATPTGEPCAWCEEAIEVPDSGLLMPHIDVGGERLRPWHAECAARSVLGGANHLRGGCSCCGGELPPDPPALTRRQAAVLAVAVAREMDPRRALP